MAEGIRKINEYVIQPGRALIVTDSLVNIENIPNGSLFVNPDNGNFRYKQTGEEEYSYFSPENIFKQKTISKNFIVDATLTDVQIQKNTITNECLKDKTINADKIKDSAILSRLIAEKNVLTSHLADKCVTEVKINDNAVSTRTIIDQAVTHAKIADAAVYDAKIKDGGIDASTKLKGKSIITSNFSDGCVTDTVIATSALRWNHFTNECVDAWAIKNKCITGGKIADLTIKTDNIANLTVTSDKLSTWAVTTDKILNEAVTNDKIANGTIESSRIKNNAVTYYKLSPDVQKSIDSAIKLSDYGIATVNGTLNVTGNAKIFGDISANRVYNAVYNDLAEGYVPGEELKPGDIVEMREDGKVYKCSLLSKTVVGVVSDEYAQCFGASEKELKTGEKIPVGLIGKVHVNVDGPIQLGDYVISYFNGNGAASKGKCDTGVVGKALETNKNNGVHKVLCLIFPS